MRPVADTSQLADALHGADGERFELEISTENGDRIFRWSGEACEIQCVVELIAARLKLVGLDSEGR